MNKPLIGLLPFYLKLYDEVSPERRKGFDKFLCLVTNKISESGIDAAVSPVCRVEAEFRRAVDLFKRKGACAIVTLHLSYSPSLESADVLAGAGLPVIALDTTPDFCFGPGQSAGRIMYNHGIHGVQDMCNLLLRNGVRFSVVAGHLKNPETMKRLRESALAAKSASTFKKMRTGIIGKPFPGMGDFLVSRKHLRETGITAVKARKEELKRLSRDISDSEIGREIRRDKKIFNVKKINPELYKNTLRSCLAVRKWVEENDLAAFTMNFMEFDGGFLPAVPFLEACKLMSRGIGYAGEGDIVAAALAGALLSVNENCTFTEMFCPDWKSGRIFLSHMGEVNIRMLEDGAELVEKKFPYTTAGNPVTAAGRLKSGRACIVNLAPDGRGKFRFIICPGKIPALRGKDNMEGVLRGWFMPASRLPGFLERFSAAGGTHHSVLVYGRPLNILKKFGMFMGWETVVC